MSGPDQPTICTVGEDGRLIIFESQFDLMRWRQWAQAEPPAHIQESLREQPLVTQQYDAQAWKAWKNADRWAVVAHAWTGAADAAIDIEQQALDAAHSAAASMRAIGQASDRPRALPPTSDSSVQMPT
jgi:hypothetical protein